MKTILIVDDSPLVRKTITSVVKSLGLNSIEAGNGLEAIKALQNAENKFDLVLTDVNMPEMNGIDLIKASLEKNLMPANLFIVITSGDDKLVKTELKSLGIKYFILKPVDETALGNALKKILAL